jgi:hypothetical protein
MALSDGDFFLGHTYITKIFPAVLEHISVVVKRETVLTLEASLEKKIQR